MSTVTSFYVFFYLFLPALAINYLPCTENVDQRHMDQAREIIQDATPAGYILGEVEAMTTTGRNPHRWIATFTRDNNEYETGCQYISAVQREFKRKCPQGAEIRCVQVKSNPNERGIKVEFLVNCFCTNIPRRRRRSLWAQCHARGYTREPALCNF